MLNYIFPQVVYGEILPLQSHNDIEGLAKFLWYRFLANPDIAREYSHPTVPGVYRPGKAFAYVTSYV